MRIYKGIIMYKWIMLLTLFQLTNNVKSQQLILGSEINWADLAYNKISGISYVSDLQLTVNKNYFSISGHFVYAVGNRGFNVQENEFYTLVDQQMRDKYPLPGIIPGLPEDAFTKTLKLKTAKTIDNGFSLMYGRKLVDNGKFGLSIHTGASISWIQETYIYDYVKGDLTNFFGTTHNVNLVVPYSQSYFTIGPCFGLKADFIKRTNFKIGFSGNATWLVNTGFKYGFGPYIHLNLFKT